MRSLTGLNSRAAGGGSAVLGAPPPPPLVLVWDRASHCRAAARSQPDASYPSMICSSDKPGNWRASWSRSWLRIGRLARPGAASIAAATIGARWSAPGSSPEDAP
jgi:hypothetical protein